MREVSRCRIVVTGSYHAGVFALSQGIPVVAVARSSYYAAKFGGLAAQFGTGCDVVLLTGEDTERRLGDAVVAAWDRAPAVREALLGAAEHQIRLSREAYSRLGDLVS
jgi:colanic acid/amylovoran biosynthesis protein